MVSDGLLETLSDETIIEIFAQLALKERARFSAINKRLYNLLHPWSDINRLTAHKDGIVLASEQCMLEVQGITRGEKDGHAVIHMLASALHSSPFIQKLVISSVEHIRTVPGTAFRHLSNIRELTLPCDIFDKESKLNDKIEAIFSIKKLLILRILKRFDTARKAKNVMSAEHIQKLQANAIKILKLQGVSLTPGAMEEISKKYSNSLKYLCLMGTLVHTPDAATYLRALCNLKNLSKLTLPPSLISLSSKPPYRECQLLRQLTAKCLCVYVYESEIVETRYFIKKLLPDALRHLCLHDPTHMVAKDLKNDEFRKLHFKVTYCRRPDSLYQQEWMHGHCELLSHMVWVPPYKHFNTEYPHPVPGWWFFMSENVETAQENTEITATDEPTTAQAQPASTQLQLPPNDDPGEMMMATIARFFERMIDDQLTADFGGAAFPMFTAGTPNQLPANTHAAASQTPVAASNLGSRSEPATGRPRRTFIAISSGRGRGRGGLSRPSSPRITSSIQTTPTQSARATQRTPSTAIHQQSVTPQSSESDDSDDEESPEQDDGSGSNGTTASGTTTMTTSTTTSGTSTPTGTGNRSASTGVRNRPTSTGARNRQQILRPEQ